MSLPILRAQPVLTAEGLARQFVQSELMLSQALCDALPLDVPAFADATLSLAAANRVLDMHASDAKTASDLCGKINAAFAAANSSVLQWCINPTLPADAREVIVAQLISLGYRARRTPLMLLRRREPLAVNEAVQMIPARSSFKLTERLFAEAALPNAEAVAEAMCRWLNEPRLDSLLAIDNGVPVGFVSVHTMGQVGRVLHLFVAEPARRRGIGRELLRRALELCQRSLFHHVFASDEEAATTRALQHVGFVQASSAELFVQS